MNILNKLLAALALVMSLGGVSAAQGTVTSVGATVPAYMGVSGSPVTTAGTLGLSFNSQTANQFFAAPNGSAGVPGFRAIVPADIPTLNQSTTGNAATATTATTAGNVTGIVAIANGGTNAATAAAARVNLGFKNAAGDDVTNTAGAHFVSGCVSIEAFGGVGDGVTDNLTPWNNAVASFGTNEMCIKFGTGTYLFSGTASATPSKNIKVMGQGKVVTHLLWNSNVAGMVLNTGNQKQVEVDGLDFVTGVVNANTALFINSGACSGSIYSSHFNDLSMRGSGNYPSAFQWGTGLDILGLSFANVTQLDVWGNASNATNGLIYRGPSSNCHALILNVSQSNFINTLTGFTYGAFAEGVTITQSNFTNGITGIYCPATSTGVYQLTVSDSQINTQQEQIVTSCTIGGVFIIGNYITVPASFHGVFINNPATVWYTIIGNIFQNSLTQGGYGIVAYNNDPTNNGGTITGNVFFHLLYGVYLNTNSSHWTVASNSYSVMGTNTLNLGTGNLVGVATP